MAGASTEPSPVTRSQTGAGAIEAIMVLLLFACLLGGLLEMTRVFRTKHTLATATFMAARAGALHHAQSAPMDAELARSMAPAYAFGRRDSEGVSKALARAAAMLALPGIGTEVISPTRPVFEQLARRQWIRRSDEASYRWQSVIPNDNLRHRPRQGAMIDTDHGQRPVLLQDANLIRVRSLWCHRLVVPGLDRLVFQLASRGGSPTARQAVCQAISDRHIEGIPRGYYLAVSADAVLRMQSAVVADDLD